MFQCDFVAAACQGGAHQNLGVTSLQRWPLFAEYPTLNESGVPDYELLIWNGIVVRAGTPQPIVERLSDSLKGTLSTTHGRTFAARPRSTK